MKIGVVAPSSSVPSVELDRGVARIRAAGFEVKLHPQCRRRHLYFAGTDEERARAFYDSAADPTIDILWSARGGYGAARILPLLDALAARHGIPSQKKLLIGYSDATALLEYVRTRWGWASLHAPMPGLRYFAELAPAAWRPIETLVRGEASWKPRSLRWIGSRPKRAIEAPLVGGNLSVWAALAGTPHEPRASGKILFIEDVTEALYRMDRMLTQLADSGGFAGVLAIVLGTFEGCNDVVPQVLAPAGGTRALRPTIPFSKWMRAVFGELSQTFGIPVAFGLPCGHGKGHVPLPLGATYRLSPTGLLELEGWDWARQ